ncbi:MAG: hypothetical protein GXO78_11345 [Calditrichaeota bacterium]|nr:hypothetical protein [Calditrichota bacterium]
MPSFLQMNDCLSTRNGHLYIEECDTVELVKQFGSPLFVFSENQIRENVQRFQRAFQNGWPDGPVKVLPAAKANWIPAIQRILASEGCGCDVYSEGELTIALEAEFEPSLISVNGVPKDEAHIYRCVDAGVRITIDSLEEVPIIERAATELNKVAHVRLRLKPALPGFTRHSDFVGEGLVPTDVAALVYKGGLTFDQVMEVAPRLLRTKNVELVGFHQHHGRHSRMLEYWEEQMRQFAREIGRVCRALDGYQPREIDIGGGFPIPRDPFNAATDYSEPLQLAALQGISNLLKVFGKGVRYRVLASLIDLFETHPNQTPAYSIEEYAEVCTRTLRQELLRHGVSLDGVMLQLEPGRSIHGNAGIHLTTVKSIKRMTHPIRWTYVIVDTTEFWFTGGRYEHHLHEYVFANKVDHPLVGKADIIGRSCYGDRILPIVPIPDVEVGDILAILDAGAYQEVSMSHFNAIPRPASVLVHGRQAELIRRRESEQDVFRRDVIPERLQRIRNRVPSEEKR